MNYRTNAYGASRSLTVSHHGLRHAISAAAIGVLCLGIALGLGGAAIFAPSVAGLGRVVFAFFALVTLAFAGLIVAGWSDVRARTRLTIEGPRITIVPWKKEPRELALDDVTGAAVHAMPGDELEVYCLRIDLREGGPILLNAGGHSSARGYYDTTAAAMNAFLGR